jgi:hypothetical protein
MYRLLLATYKARVAWRWRSARAGLGISALGVDVEPWTPSSYKPILLEEPLRDRVVSKIIPVRETYRVGYEL